MSNGGGSAERLVGKQRAVDPALLDRAAESFHLHPVAVDRQDLDHGRALDGFDHVGGLGRRLPQVRSAGPDEETAADQRRNNLRFVGRLQARAVIAQVVGVPDETYGEVPVAFVELVSGATVSAEELITHCEGEIASFKIPREVRFVDEWPMSATKIQKFKLREMLDA